MLNPMQFTEGGHTWPDSVRFDFNSDHKNGLHTHQGMMEDLSGVPAQRKFQAPSTNEWGHLVKPRPPKVDQPPLPFEPSPATTPKDEHLHQLRLGNPKLNDYQFGAHIRSDGSGQSNAYDSDTGNQIGHLRWAGERGGMNEWSSEDYKPHEVEYINVQHDHKNKGIAEGLWDYARARGANPHHSSERSEQGEAFARRVGGPEYKRTKGFGSQEL